MTSPPTGTVTFLFTDIEGSTRLWDADSAAMVEAVSVHDALIRSAIEDRGGYVFSTAGDSFAAAFQVPGEALAAAVDAQLALKRQAWAGGNALRVRMALHSGNASERAGDYFGSAPNRCARLLALASGGQLLLTEAAHALVKENLPDGVSFLDHGVHRLRDLSSTERVFALVHPDLDPAHELIRSVESRPNNLPIQVTSFVGRDQELEEAIKLLSGSRLLTITGVGGSGKTRLALQVATSVFDRYRDGIWLVELAPVAEPEGVARAVAAALGLREQAGQTIEETVTEHLRPLQALLILDNCEHLLDTAARLAQGLLSTASQLTILATSREMLGIAGEVPYQLRSMSLPTRDDPVEAINRFDAVRLFCARAEAVRAGFRVGKENSQAVVSLCQRLDGMPLAIELAAARLRILSPEQIASRLDDRFRLLTGGSRTALPRQQTLEAAIDWSYDLLEDREKTLFARLSVFQGGFTLEAAEAVCGAAPIARDDVLELLSHVVDKSLVIATVTQDGVRYRMLETLRQYARERLSESQEVESLREAHALYFRGLAETALPKLRGPEERRWLDLLEAEHDNLRQVLRWAIDSERAALAQGLAGTLYRFWMIAHHSEEGRDWLGQALALAPEERNAHARALLGAGTLASTHGAWMAAERSLEAAVTGLRVENERGLLSAAIHNLGAVKTALGDYGAASALLTEEFETAAADHDLQSMTFASQQLALLAHARGDDAEARRLFRQAIDFARQAKSIELLGNALSTLAIESLVTSDLASARAASDDLYALGSIPSAPDRHHVIRALVDGRAGGDSAELLRVIKESWARELRQLADYRSIFVVMVEVFTEMARHELALGFTARAATLLGGSEQLLRDSKRLPHQQAHFEEQKAAVQASMPAAEFDAAFHRGLTFPVDDLFDFAIS